LGYLPLKYALSEQPCVKLGGIVLAQQHDAVCHNEQRHQRKQYDQRGFDGAAAYSAHLRYAPVPKADKNLANGYVLSIIIFNALLALWGFICVSFPVRIGILSIYYITKNESQIVFAPEQQTKCPFDINFFSPVSPGCSPFRL
jgi:hypothetical protein